MQEDQSENLKNSKSKWSPDPVELLNEETENYFIASTNLQGFVENFANYKELPNPEDYDSLKDFLQAMAEEMASCLPFSDRGIGNSTIEEQAFILRVYKNMDTLKKDLLEQRSDKVDCKLPSAGIAYLLDWYFHTNNWPLEVGLLTVTKSPHVYATVRIKPNTHPEDIREFNEFLPVNSNDFIFIDYQADGDMNNTNTYEHQIDRTLELVSLGRCTYDNILIEGLMNYDKRYLEAVAEEDN